MWQPQALLNSSRDLSRSSSPPAARHKWGEGRGLKALLEARQATSPHMCSPKSASLGGSNRIQPGLSQRHRHCGRRSYQSWKRIRGAGSNLLQKAAQLEKTRGFGRGGEEEEEEEAALLALLQETPAEGRQAATTAAARQKRGVW